MTSGEQRDDSNKGFYPHYADDKEVERANNWQKDGKGERLSG